MRVGLETRNLHHVAIYVANMGRALHLFEDLLGFNLCWRTERLDVSKLSNMLNTPLTEVELAYLQAGPGGGAIELVCPIRGNSIENLFYCGGPPGAPGTFHLSLMVEDIEGLYQHLTEEGWPPLTPIIPTHIATGESIRLFFFRTEDGVTIEVFEAGGKEET